MKRAKNFQTAKVQLQGVAWLLLDILQFQPGVAYKRVDSCEYPTPCTSLTTSA